MTLDEWIEWLSARIRLVRVREDAFDARVWLTDLGLAVVRVCSRWEGR